MPTNTEIQQPNGEVIRRMNSQDIELGHDPAGRTSKRDAIQQSDERMATYTPEQRAELERRFREAVPKGGDAQSSNLAVATPRTDAAIEYYPEIDRYIVNPDFARTIETELAVLTARLYEDRANLDWLEKWILGSPLAEIVHPDGAGDFWELCNGDERVYIGQTLREAITNARQEKCDHCGQVDCECSVHDTSSDSSDNNQ